MGNEMNARMLIVPASQPGKIINAMTGRAQGLIARGQINSHHRIGAPDGVEIDVWVINGRHSQTPEGPPRHTVVLVHPLLCAKGWFLKLGQMFAEMGWDVVLPDLRGHGDSGGKYITWGAKEKHDLKAVMDRLIADGVVSDSVYVLGSSMGGAVAIQYAAIEPRCRGVMALAPPKSARAICRRILMLHSTRSFEAALTRASELAEFDPDDASAEAAAASVRCPLLILHGLFDIIVPYDHGRAIVRAAAGPSGLRPMVLRGHAVEFFNEREMIKYFFEMVAMAPGAAPRARRGSTGCA